MTTGKRVTDLLAEASPASGDFLLLVKADGSAFKVDFANFGGGGSGEDNPDAATQPEAETGTETALRSWSPLRVAQAIAALAGFRNVPLNGDKTSSYTLATGDVGKAVTVGSGGSVTIPNSTFSGGDVVSVYNATASDVTMTCSTATSYIAGADADKATMTLASRGLATVLFLSGTTCVVSGNVS